MDMWKPSANSTRAHPMPRDKIVFDRYHLMGYLTKATDTDTDSEHENRTLSAAGDKSLAGSTYRWLCSHENLPTRHQDRFNAQRATDPKTGRAWAIKEDLRHFWSHKRRGRAARHCKR